MYEGVCYKKPFLKEVIFKIDLLSPLQDLGKSLPSKLTKAILKKFPISEPQKGHAQEFLFKGTDFQAKSTEIMQWIFHGKNREKTLVITPDAISYTNRDYTNYEFLLEDIESVVNIFFEEVSEATTSRLGIRYINVVDVDEDKPLEWKEYINEAILGIIDFHDENQFLTRAFHILEYNFDGLAVKHQFGIANPDFPAVIRKKQFVIDIDAYSHGSFELPDIKIFMNDGHAKIQDIFEHSITDKTRELMKPENAD